MLILKYYYSIHLVKLICLHYVGSVHNREKNMNKKVYLYHYGDEFKTILCQSEWISTQAIIIKFVAYTYILGHKPFGVFNNKQDILNSGLNVNSF